MMDDSTIEATQALDFGDYEEETDDDLNRVQEPVGYLKVPCQKGFPEKLYPVYQGDNVIGRHDSCKISIPMKGLSREHACIEVKGDALFIYDKGSRNRTQKNTHFLTASVRYELKDNDRLTFGDVDCSFQVGGQVQGADGDDTGSETGSESMFQTAGPGGEDCHSDGSSDILEPTQPFAANTQSMIKMGRKTNDASATLGITVEDTPAASRTKRFTDSLLIPDSDLEDDEASSPLSILAADTQGKQEDVRSKLITAPTQDYVSDSDATTDDDKRTKSILTAATQAFTEDDISTCSEDSPRKHSILTAATQAFVGDSDADSPIKKDAKKNLQLEPTQGYDMEKGIEPTMAYDMDDDDGDTDEADKEEVCSVSKGGSMMFEPTQAYTDNTELSDLDDKEEETSVKKGGSMMFEPTQAYVDNAEMAADKSKGDDQSDTSEEFVLDGDTDNEGGEGSDGEVMSGLLAAPTLAMDMGDNPQVFDHEDATNIADDNATVGVDDHDQTVPVAESGKEAPKPYSRKGNKGKQLDKATKDLEIATVNIDETVAVQADATVAVDATITVNESDATMAIDKIDATVEVKEVDATVEINQVEATVAINEDNTTVAIKEVDATVAINEVDATVAVMETDATMAINEVESTVAVMEADATMAINEVDATVAVMEPDAAVAIKEVDATVALMEPDATVAINEVDATVAVMEADATMAINEVESTVAVMEADATMAINEVDATVAVMEPDATVAINEVDASVAVMEADVNIAANEFDATVEITDIVTEETALKSKNTSASDNEDSIQVFGMEEHEQCTDDVSVIAKQDDEAVEMEQTKVIDFDVTETIPVTSVAVKKGGRGRSKVKAVVNEKQKKQSVSENSKTNTRSKGRNQTKTVTVKEAATVKSQTNRGRRSRKEKNEPIEDNEAATQVYDDNLEEAVTEADATAPKTNSTAASDNEESTQVFGMDEHEQCTDDVSVIAKDKAMEMEPTQVFDVDVTETVPETTIAVKKSGRGKNKGKAVVNEKQEQSVSENSKTNARSKGRSNTKTETVKEASMVKPQINRGRRSRKEKNEPIVDNEAATQVYEDNSEEAVTEADATAPKTNSTAASDNEESTQVFGMDEHEQCTDDVPVIAKEDDEAAEMEPTQVFDVDVTETVPLSSVAVKKSGRGRSKVKAAANEKQEEIVSENSKTNARSKGRSKTKTETVKEATTVKPQTNRGRRSRKEKNEPIVDNEAATQVYEDNSEEAGPSDEPATQMYVDEDATPSLSELCEDVPDVESMLSRSPLKSALASPKKKSPSPKRVQFMSQSSETGSEASETSAGRPRRGRKLDEIDRKMDKDEKKKGKGSGRARTAVSQEKEDGVTDAISSESKPNRVTRGKVTNVTDSKQPALKSRRSVGNEVAVSEEIVNSRGRSSLPTVLDKKSSRSSRRDKTAKIEESIAVKNDEFGSHTEVIKNEKVSKRGRKEVEKRENETVPAAETDTNTAQSDEPIKSRAKRKGREEIVDENNKKEVIVETIPTESVDKRKSRGIVKSKESKVGNTTEKDMQSDVSRKRGCRNSKITTQSDSDKQIEDIVDNDSSVDETGITTKMQSGRQTRGKKVTSETTDIESDKTKSETNEPVRTKVINIESKELKTNVSNKIPDNSESVLKGKSRTTKRNIKVDHTESETKRTRTKAGGDANVNIDANTKTDLNEVTERTMDKGGKSIREKAKQTNEKVSKTIGQPEVKLDSDDSVSKKSIRGKRKESADSSMDSSQTVDGQTPAKKLKTRNSQETVVVTPHSSNKRTSLPATETPKTNAKKLSSMSTPKGSSTKELDTSLVNSPTLRKTTTEGTKARVMFTGVVDDLGEKIVKELGGELVSSVYDCTHLVTDQIRRTVKFLCCLSRGVPIVSPQWLISSKRSGFFSDPSSFLISDDACEKKFKLSLRRSLDKANERPLFSGYKIHVTKSVKPEPAHMKDIVQCAGAQYVESMPRKASPNMVVISCKEDQSQLGLAMKAGIPVVNAEFVLSGILRQEVDVNAFSLISGDTGSQGQQSSEPSSKKRKR